MAPKAIAIGRPIIPVPGIPTPIAFLRILALSRTEIFSGSVPNNSVARATHNDTATGSVQPMAGITSLLIRAIIASRSAAGNIIVNFKFPQKYKLSAIIAILVAKKYIYTKIKKRRIREMRLNLQN
jgi:hypothetical protein